jgi:hypothetical protein
MDVRTRPTGFQFLFAAEVAVRPHIVGDTLLMELAPVRIYLNRMTNFLHAVQNFRAADGTDMIRSVCDEDLHDLGATETLAAPRSHEWIGLVSTGQPLIAIAAKIRAAQEARDNGLYWQPDDDVVAAGQVVEDSDLTDDF